VEEAIAGPEARLVVDLKCESCGSEHWEKVDLEGRLYYRCAGSWANGDDCRRLRPIPVPKDPPPVSNIADEPNPITSQPKIDDGSADPAVAREALIRSAQAVRGLPHVRAERQIMASARWWQARAHAVAEASGTFHTLGHELIRTNVLRLGLTVLVGLALLTGCDSGSPSNSRAAAATQPLPSQSGDPSAASASDACGNGAFCVLNPSVTQATICVSGWTATVRPSTSETTPLKVEQMAQLHLSGTPTDYEEDHRMPLELGGDPIARHNLSPEAHLSLGGQSEAKDSSENAAKDEVCSGRKTLVEAQQAFVAMWLSVWPNYRTPSPISAPTATATPPPASSAPPCR